MTAHAANCFHPASTAHTKIALNKATGNGRGAPLVQEHSKCQPASKSGLNFSQTRLLRLHTNQGHPIGVQGGYVGVERYAICGDQPVKHQGLGVEGFNLDADVAWMQTGGKGRDRSCMQTEGHRPQQRHAVQVSGWPKPTAASERRSALTAIWSRSKRRGLFKQTMAAAKASA